MYKFQESCPLQTPENLVDVNVLLFLFTCIKILDCWEGSPFVSTLMLSVLLEPRLSWHYDLALFPLCPAYKHAVPSDHATNHGRPCKSGWLRRRLLFPDDQRNDVRNCLCRLQSIDSESKFAIFQLFRMLFVRRFDSLFYFVPREHQKRENTCVWFRIGIFKTSKLVWHLFGYCMVRKFWLLVIF